MDHGYKYVKFRNIRAKKLTRNPWGPESPYLNRTAAAKGDTSLIDTLTFATPLFPATANGTRIAHRPGTVPKSRMVPVHGGMGAVEGGSANDKLRVYDLRGVVLPLPGEQNGITPISR